MVKFFLLASVLFLAQVLAGGMTAHYRADPRSFYGIDTASFFPGNIFRVWHLQLALFWIITCLIAGGLFLSGSFGKEPRMQARNINVLFWALFLVIFGSLLGEMLGIFQLTGNLWYWLGNQGWEYLDLGRAWQYLLAAGLVFWVFLLIRQVRPALRNPAEREMPWLFLFLGLNINLNPGTSLGDAVKRVQDEARAVIPPSITTSLQGAAQAFQSSIQGLGILLIIAILVIYIILGILYESFIHPLTILSGLPSAGVGALLTLMLFRMDLNLYSFVGIILLIGIVKKNAIMMIDFAQAAQKEQGLKPAEAIYQGSIIRFRPIMMTTFAALMATLPIALGIGAGAESRRPLGLAVVGGLVFSQMITLYITPVIYTYLDNLQGRIQGRFKFLRRGTK